MNSSQSPRPPTLIVDLDGTLLKTDSLVELLVKSLRRPHIFFRSLPFLLQSKAAWKDYLANYIEVDIENWPFCGKVLDYIQSQVTSGPRKVLLATGAHSKIAERVHSKFPLFHGTLCSNSDFNCTGPQKLSKILVSEPEFEYIGNSFVDLPIWEKSQTVICARGSRGLASRLVALNKPILLLSEEQKLKTTIGSLLKAMRLHQWVKNLLVFVPLVAAHSLSRPDAIENLIIMFFAFSLCASAVYILNDLMDLDDDRQHPTKKHRPFASGDLSPLTGLGLIPALVGGSFFLSLTISLPSLCVLIGYFVITCTYSFFLKKLFILDVLCLALLYTLRVVAGHVAGNFEFSWWLINFSIFLFLSLALLKRYSELVLYRNLGSEKLHGRSYRTQDLVSIASMGSSCGFISILTFSLYSNSQQVTRLYSRPEVLFLALLPLIYWTGRIWLLAGRGEVNQDPILFAVKDKVSYICLGLFILVLFGAI